MTLTDSTTVSFPFRHSSLLILAAMLMSFHLAGCGGGGGGTPDLGTVTGIVTMDDKPLTDANVVFKPANGSPSYGSTDATGRYELSYSTTAKGATLGGHSVEITTFQSDVEDSEEDEIDEDEDEEGEDPAIAAMEKVPARYNINSELTAEVNAGSNEFNFALTSGGPIGETPGGEDDDSSGDDDDE